MSNRVSPQTSGPTGSIELFARQPRDEPWHDHDDLVLLVTAREGDDVIGGSTLCRQGNVVTTREELGVGCPAGQRPPGEVELDPPVRFRLEQISGQPAAGTTPR